MNRHLRSASVSSQCRSHHFILDIELGLLIIALLIGSFLYQIPTTVGKAQLTDAMTLFTQARLEVIEHYATTGDWLSEEVSVGDKLIKELRDAELSIFKHMYGKSSSFAEARLDRIERGAVHLRLYNRRSAAAKVELLSLRPAVLPNSSATVLWVCGNHPIPEHLLVSGTDLTTIPPSGNYRFCR